MSGWRVEGPESLTLALHVQPGAKRTEVSGLHGVALKIRVAAPAVDGKANAVLLRFLAEAFGVPLRRVRIVRGATSRDKTVEVTDPIRRPDRAWH